MYVTQRKAAPSPFEARLIAYWTDRIGPEEGPKQAQWEFHQTIKRAVRSGMTQRDAAKRFGYSRGRIQQIVENKARSAGPPPASSYLRPAHMIVASIADEPGIQFFNGFIAS